MLRKVMVAALAAGAMMFSTMALAITTNVTITSGGKEVPNATVKLTVHPPGKPTYTRTVKTTSTGKIRVTTSEKRKEEIDRTVVDVTIVTSTGERTTTVPLSSLTGGGTVDVGGPPTAFVPNAPNTPYMPSGPYVGLGGGGTTTNCPDIRTTQNRSPPGGVTDPVSADNTACLSSAARVSVYTGFMRTISGNWLGGLEADVGYSNHNKSQSTIPGSVGVFGLPAGAAANDSISLRQTWDAGLRARLGYMVTPSVMVFGSGGGALTETKVTVNCTAAGACGNFGVPTYSASNSKTMAGWSLGAGVEAKIYQNWVARFEYRYTDYGHFSSTYGNPLVTFAPTMDVRLRQNLFMAGVSYQMDGPR